MASPLRVTSRSIAWGDDKPLPPPGKVAPLEREQLVSTKMEGGQRVIYLAKGSDSRNAVNKYCDNVVVTSKYTALNFIPVNLFEQLMEPANIYFLLVGILQVIKSISTTEGVPTMYVPLAFILTVSAVRAALEDYDRHKQDNALAARQYMVLDRTANPPGFAPKASGKLAVGDIVMMTRPHSDTFPADLCFLASHHRKGHAYVETASLDGETNLKNKSSVNEVHNVLVSPQPAEKPSLDPVILEKQKAARRAEELQTLLQLNMTIRCRQPDRELRSWGGVMEITHNGQTVTSELTAQHLLLRETEVRNTEYLYGAVVYTGSDTKARRNVEEAGDGKWYHKIIPKRSAMKKSSLMRIVDKCLLGMLILQSVFCLIGGITAGALHKDQQNAWYLQVEGSSAVEGILRYFTWFIILSQMVPISLLVSTEIVKKGQAFFIGWDNDINYQQGKEPLPTEVKSSLLNEDLGQIEYVFSDKTGTLTQNKMDFRVGIVDGVMYGDPTSEIAKRVEAKMRMKQARDEGKVIHEERMPYTEAVEQLKAREAEAGGVAIGFSGEAKHRMLTEIWGPKEGLENAPIDLEDDTPRAGKGRLHTYMLHMALSNTITPVVDAETGETTFQSSSPDELALCKYAQYMGFQFQSRTPQGAELVIDNQGYGGKREPERQVFKQLATLDFNSKRKRVTIVYNQGDTVYVMTKGQDARVIDLLDLDEAGKHNLDNLQDDMTSLYKKGLRSMMVAGANLPVEWWTGSEGKEGAGAIWKFIRGLPEEGEEQGHGKGECGDLCRICKGMRDIEVSAKLELLGATALEDKLQDLVPECIADFLEAGIKVWMLTGDKRDTAKNIGLACNLIDPDMERPESMVKGQPEMMNRLIEITGSWSEITKDSQTLRQLFHMLDIGSTEFGPAQDGEKIADGYINKDELRFFLEGMNVNLNGNLTFEEIWDSVDLNKNDRIDFEEFVKFMRSVQPTTFEAVYTDIKEGLKRVYEICGGYGVSESRIAKKLEVNPVSLVLEGSAMSALYPPVDQVDERVSAEERAQAQDMFFELASRAKSVIACSLTPNQKALIVTQIQKRKKAVTLAIGDGGNDEKMIRMANIGVGISGEEGTAASRASDYAIGQFRFLHTLLFVHGYWSYDRISKLVCFIFYKASLVALTMYVFGFFSSFSGQQFFNDVSYQFYNVAFTALPIITLAIFDQQLKKETLENVPKAYYHIRGAKLFNVGVFCQWILRAILHVILCFFIPVLTLGFDHVSSKDGHLHGLWYVSTVTYAAVVFVPTFRIYLELTSVKFMDHFVIWLSFVGYCLIQTLLSIFPKINTVLYDIVAEVVSSGLAWFALILAVSLPLLLDVVLYSVRREVQPQYYQILQEQQRSNAVLKDRKARESLELSIRQSQVTQMSQRHDLIHARQNTHQSFRKGVKHRIEDVHGGPVAHLQETTLEAVIYTLMRFQNLSGSTLSANPDTARSTDFFELPLHDQGDQDEEHKEAHKPEQEQGGQEEKAREEPVSEEETEVEQAHEQEAEVEQKQPEQADGEAPALNTVVTINDNGPEPDTDHETESEIERANLIEEEQDRYAQQEADIMEEPERETAEDGEEEEKERLMGDDA